MPTTRKKVIKTVYKNEDDSEIEDGDFSDSGSEAVISQPSSSDDEDEPYNHDSSEEIKKKNKIQKPKTKRKQFTKSFMEKLTKQNTSSNKDDDDSKPESKPSFSIKDLTEADKLLPTFLNLSESDSSDDEEHKVQSKPVIHTPAKPDKFETDTTEKVVEYQDVWSNNLKESEEIAQRAFLELEKHKTKLEETKKSIQKYKVQNKTAHESDIKDLLALGEDVIPSAVTPPKSKKGKNIKSRNNSDSEIEDWEEVADAKTIPQQGLQLIVDIPGAVCRKTKKLDVEMMMKRKINRVKKEYQVYMHKVHVLCWLGHGNFVSQVLNDQDVLSASLSLIPSKECYPGERVDMKYVEQITNWFKDKLTIKFDKNEGKFRPKAPPLKNLILQQIKRRSVTSKKYVVFIFISMLRALGLQCRIILNFTTLPIKPPITELCSLSTKAKTDVTGNEKEVKSKGSKKQSSKKLTNKKTGDCIPQLDGNYDYLSDSDYDSIIQLDGNDDTSPKRSAAVKGIKKSDQNSNDMCDDVSPPKRSKRNFKVKNNDFNSSQKLQTAENNLHVGGTSTDDGLRKRPNSPVLNVQANHNTKEGKSTEGVSPPKRSRRNLSVKKAVDFGNIINKDGSNSQKQNLPVKAASKTDHNNSENQNLREEVSLPTRRRRNLSVKKVESNTIKLEDTVNINETPTVEKKDMDGKDEQSVVKKITRKSLSLNKKHSSAKQKFDTIESKALSTPTTKYSENVKNPDNKVVNVNPHEKNIPAIVITAANALCPKIKDGKHSESKRDIRTRKRSHTCDPEEKQKAIPTEKEIKKPRANSASSGTVGSSQKKSSKSKYFNDSEKDEKFNVNKKLRSSRKIENKDTMRQNNVTDMIDDDSKRVSHRDLASKTQLKMKNDVTHDLVNIIKKRVQEAKDSRKVKTNKSSDEDSDYLPEITEQQKASTSKNGNAKVGTARKIDRRVVSTDDESPENKIDVWCEVYVEELEQWIAVDVIKGRVHCVNEIYSGTTHPVNYVVGWDNNNYLKDLTRRYVPHWNTVTRKQRVDPAWWDEAVRPWLGPKTARDREEDEGLDRMQLDAPLPKSIAEYKNHPLYALKRHLLKFEAIYPPDAATLGFVRGEAVYARECVYVCRSRDTWLKEAKVVRLGEEPYKVVKARPKWDRLSNKLITDKPLEVFGPWQVQDYEPPVAENGIVPRNAYGNVELFKECMLPKGTVHIKLPGLNRVAKKLNIDCAPAMTGFDFNGGWSHPVYDGFVVCQEFEDIITNAWHEDQLEQERKELEKLEARVYGNWRRLIKGLLIRERLKLKYGFSEPSTSQNTKKTSTNPKLTVKKNCFNSKRKS